MPEPRYRSRSKRRKKIVTPSGKNTMHYLGRNAGVVKCAQCHQELHGVPRMSKVIGCKLKKLQKRPERMYGGHICPQCLKTLLKKTARKEMKS
jgi:large subunit ribosomal protein L34e